MNGDHKWAQPRFRRSHLVFHYRRKVEYAKREPWWTPLPNRKMHCVNCGAETWSVKRHDWLFPKKVFRPWAGQTEIAKRMPRCEGLPANYEAPMGA